MNQVDSYMKAISISIYSYNKEQQPDPFGIGVCFGVALGMLLQCNINMVKLCCNWGKTNKFDYDYTWEHSKLIWSPC